MFNTFKLRQLKDILCREILISLQDASLSLYDFCTDSKIEIKGEEPFYPASMIKTLLLLTALRQAEEGSFSLDMLHILTERDRYAGKTPVTGSGVLQHAENGSIYTFQELLSLMVSVSDNIATNIIFDRIGPGLIRQMSIKLDLKKTAFTRKMYELDSPLPSNVSTACDLTAMLIALEKEIAAGTALSETGIRLMIETTDKTRLGRYLGKDGMVIANKVGTVTGIIGDMALIYFRHRAPLAMTVVIKNPADPEEAAQLIGLLAKLTVEHLR